MPSRIWTWASLLPASRPHRLWSTKDYRPPHHLALLFLLCFSRDGTCPRIQSFGRAPTDSPCETHRSSLLRLTTMLRFSKPAVLTRRPLATVPERNNSCCFQSQTLRPLTLCPVVVYLFFLGGGCVAAQLTPSFDLHYLSFTPVRSYFLLFFISQGACLLPSVFFLSRPLSPHSSRATN